MFEKLMRQLMAPAPEPLPAPEARLALAALLVRLARADGAYATAEVARIDRVLAHRYRLDAGDTAALRHEAEMLELEAPDTVRFTRALKDAVPHEDRTGVLQAMWAVALADGARGAEEEQVIRLVANLLGLSDMDSAIARQSIEGTA